MDLGDGLAALKAHLSVREVARLIEATARWVDPDTFRLVPVQEYDPSDYLRSWARGRVPGIVPLTPAIRKSAERRKAQIRAGIQGGGEFYPRQEVREALLYWKLSL